MKGALWLLWSNARDRYSCTSPPIETTSLVKSNRLSLPVNIGYVLCGDVVTHCYLLSLVASSRATLYFRTQMA